MSNTNPPPPPVGEYRLFDRALGPLTAGRYKIEIEQGFDSEQGSVSKFFDVTGPRWGLEATEVPAERAIVHIRLASVLRDKLGQEELALAHLEMSVEACPDAEETLWPLAQHYMEGELWAKALPLLTSKHMEMVLQPSPILQFRSIPRSQ